MIVLLSVVVTAGGSTVVAVEFVAVSVLKIDVCHDILVKMKRAQI